MQTNPAPPRPMALELIPEAIPRELTGWDHFLLWNWVLRENGKGERVWTKPPFRINGSGLAKSTDADGWGSFRAAIAARDAQRMAGIGFALAGDDPFCFGDLDDCLDPATGEIAAWAKPVVERFRHSYQEISPSGTGIKILVKGKLPGTEHRWRVDKDDPTAYVEWFDSAKYTTLTGHRLPNTGEDIADAQDRLNELYRLCFPSESVRASSKEWTPPASTDDDDARLSKARSSRQGADFMRLFDAGDVSHYGNDRSVADLALCGMLAFWFGPDPARIDRMFRRSKLMRDKWDERQDYRDATVSEALSGRTEFYTPPADRRLKVVGKDDPAGAPKRRTKWSATDLVAADLPEPRWAVPDLLPEGLAILAGRPKKGKSLLALSVAIAVAGGTPALGHFDVDESGPVLFVALEDFERRLQDRLGDMLGKRGAPPMLDVWTFCPRIGEGFKEEVGGWLRDHPNARLVVLDTYQRVRPTPKGPDKNTYAVDYEDAALLQSIAIEYRVCILLIQHTRKPAAGGDPFDEIMGTTGNAAAADALLVLQTAVGRAEAKLHVTGRDLAESEHAMGQDPATGRWLRTGDAADVRRSGQRDAILSAIRVAGPEGLAPREIAVATKQRGANVRYLLHRMRNDGEVSEHQGRYFEKAPNTPNALTVASFSASGQGFFGDEGVRGGVRGADAPNVSGVRGVSDMSDVRSVSGAESWVCGCGASVVGHLAHCPVCGERRPP